ncbi:hypothetical protein EXM36_07815 [Clostridium botulinum]|uniref:hypothetical protein n=1 Tax=Clostridium botulinum TaxID=1491 RepID=UPI001375ACC7|nr:hypothetical protein [Clostridium botulinum]MCC5417428.1 hypothetical protein [Clostridium botulinum]NCI21254.1 hypothetical protein [Clostridium botulinum]NCI36827.1 hypothetical protein [Clostridium botulinum]NCI72908.1 hypothetical protein [Clostridium botulinum]NDI39799.1 hypothetical protein [Clostridium botulinum]
MDLNRIKDFKVDLLYEDGKNTGGVITNYKPPRPAYFRKGIRTVQGYTYFEKNIKSDCIIEFTVVFNIKGENDEETQSNITKFLDFRKNYSGRFIFVDEFGIQYKGYLQNKFEIDTPIEGDIYYINLELLCNHEASGWVKDNGKV